MPQSMTTARDIPILVTSTASSSERRITPSWTIAHLKTKLEPVTGIPPASQKLTLRLPDQQQEHPIEAQDEESVELGSWPLVAYAEIKVQKPASLFYIAAHEANHFQISKFGIETCVSLHSFFSPRLYLPCGIIGVCHVNCDIPIQAVGGFFALKRPFSQLAISFSISPFAH